MLFTEGQLRQRAAIRTTATKAAADILKENRDTRASDFDIFLSHSMLDAEIVLGAKLELEDYGFSVYVDWLCDPFLDRTKVTSRTAEHLRSRMRQCKILAYLHSENSSISRWCPWELGYFDGLRGGNVFILPVTSGPRSTFDGQEYLGLYPYLTPANASKNIWIEKISGAAFLSEARSKVFVRKTA